MAALLSPSGVHGTYSAFLFADNVIVIGADSRATETATNQSYDDECKIITLSDTIAFTLIGAAQFAPLGPDRVDMYSIAKTIPLAEPSEMAHNFGIFAVEKLNSFKVPHDPKYPLTGGGFAGFTEAGPVVALRTISFNIKEMRFEHAGRPAPHKQQTSSGVTPTSAKGRFR